MAKVSLSKVTSEVEDYLDGAYKDYYFYRDMGTPEAAQRAEYAVHVARENALTAIDRALVDVGNEMTEPPTADGAAYINAISGRKNYTAAEGYAAYERFGNHSVQRAIIEATERAGIPTGGTTDAEDKLTALQALRGEAERMFTVMRVADANTPAKQKWNIHMLGAAADGMDGVDAMRAAFGI